MEKITGSKPTSTDIILEATAPPARDSHYPNLNILKFLLATLVTWSHCYPLTNHDEPLARLTRHINGGSLGVWGFFFISDFLVTQSYRRRPNCFLFIINRILRIWPALIAALLVSILLGWLTSHTEWVTFKRGAVDYFVTNIKLIAGVAYSLPGAFPESPFPSVNGSLWTLPWEIRMYVIVAILGISGVLAKREPLNLSLMILTAGAITLPHISSIAAIFDNITVPWMLVSFLLGVATYANLHDTQPNSGISEQPFDAPKRLGKWTQKVSKLDLFALGLVTMGVGAMICGFSKTFWLLILCGFVLLTGFSRLIPPVKWKHDLSYGIYIYSFPVQQYLINETGLRAPWKIFLLTMPIVLLLAYLSWRFVEKPFLSLKSRPPKGGSIICPSNNQHLKPSQI